MIIASTSRFYSVLNVKAFNQEKALVQAFSVITNLRVDICLKLYCTHYTLSNNSHSMYLSPVLSSPAMQARDADRGTTSRLLVAVLVLAVSICPGSQFSPAENEIPDDNIVTNNK